MTYTKVTEVVGELTTAEEGWEYIFDDRDPVNLSVFVPPEATMKTRNHGPRGRFRITVEFTPEESDGAVPTT